MKRLLVTAKKTTGRYEFNVLQPFFLLSISYNFGSEMLLRVFVGCPEVFYTYKLKEGHCERCCRRQLNPFLLIT